MVFALHENILIINKNVFWRQEKSKERTTRQEKSEASNCESDFGRRVVSGENIDFENVLAKRMPERTLNHKRGDSEPNDNKSAHSRRTGNNNDFRYLGHSWHAGFHCLVVHVLQRSRRRAFRVRD